MDKLSLETSAAPENTAVIVADLEVSKEVSILEAESKKVVSAIYRSTYSIS